MSVTSAVFFWGLAAVSVPLLLHLCRRRKFRQVVIGSLRFLREASQSRRRRSRLEEILLLLFRCAAIVLLVLLFARPFFPGAHEASEGKERETIVLLDASGSMTAGMASEVRREARGYLQGEEGEVITLAQFSDRVEALDGLESYKPRAGAATAVEGALNWALDRILLKGEQQGRVVLIGHFAKDALPSEPPRVWPAGVPVEVVAVDPPAKANAAVRDVSLLTPFVGEKMEIEAAVQLPMGTARKVTLLAEGLELSEDVPKGMNRVVFRFRPPRDTIRGVVQVEEGDPWPADDARPFALRWVHPRKVLLIDGNPGSTPFEGNAYFIEKALLASGADHGRSPFQPEVAYGLEGRQGMTDVSEVGAVALCGVTDLSVAAARILRDYVKKGGGLVHILDEEWTASATAALEEEGLFPPAVALTGDVRIDQWSDWDRNHAALASFDGVEGGDLRSLRWRDGFDVRGNEDWKVLAKFDNGHALLLEKARSSEGEGRVMVLAHPLTREWTDLPREPLFVPFVKSLFGSLANFESAGNGVAPGTSPGAGETRQPGIYETGDGAVHVVAPAPGESSIEAAGAEAVRTAFGLPEPGAAEEALAAIEESRRADENSLGAAHRPRGHEIWPWIALLLLLWLAGENWLATRKVETRSVT